MMRTPFVTALALALLAGCHTDPPAESSPGGPAVAEASPPAPSDPTQIQPEVEAEPVPEVEPEPAPEAQAEPDAPSLGTTQADADALCAEIASDHDEESTVLACKLSQGQVLAGGGRVDILELTLTGTEYGELGQAHLLLRLPDDDDDQQLAEAYDIPGQSVEYTLGKLQVSGDVIRVESTEIETTYPNTGEPDEPTNEQIERAVFDTTCSIADADCSREPRE